MLKTIPIVAIGLLSALVGARGAAAQSAASSPVPSSASAEATGAMLASAAGESVAVGERERWLDRVDLFVGLDGSKQPQDLGVNANIGPRAAVNVGVPLVRTSGFGLQAGVAVNVSDAAVAVLERVDGTSRRTQVFTTLGLFQRLDRLQWAVVHDVVKQSYFSDTITAQVRGEVMLAVGRHDQVGAWFTAPTRRADAAIADTAVRLAPIPQVNATARHTWPSGATTGLWLGVASGHHNVVLVFPENTRDRHVLVYGATLTMPLNARWSVTGATNLITPSASGTVDAFMGVSVRLGRGHGSRFSPPLAVANNTGFSVDLSRR